MGCLMELQIAILSPSVKASHCERSATEKKFAEGGVGNVRVKGEE
jgi:hypothetical protein